jgi:hypothetical protein
LKDQGVDGIKMDLMEIGGLSGMRWRTFGFWRHGVSLSHTHTHTHSRVARTRTHTETPNTQRSLIHVGWK